MHVHMFVYVYEFVYLYVCDYVYICVCVTWRPRWHSHDVLMAIFFNKITSTQMKTTSM